MKKFGAINSYSTKLILHMILFTLMIAYVKTLAMK